ncbi:MAG: 4-hydroxy-3-methylbut-2-enyl diphosphate reductase, partial [Thermocrispum sp.]
VRLVELAHKLGTPAYLIDGPAQLQPGWLVGVDRIGMTAGASAPHSMVDATLRVLRELGPLTVTEHVTATEDIQFTLPPTSR